MPQSDKPILSDALAGTTQLLLPSKSTQLTTKHRDLYLPDFGSDFHLANKKAALGAAFSVLVEALAYLRGPSFLLKPAFRLGC